MVDIAGGKMKKRWIRGIVVLLCLFLFALYRIKPETKTDILKEVEIDSVGYYYDKDLVSTQNKKVDFFTTLYTNRLKNAINTDIVNAKMSKLEGFNLENFVCVLQLVKNEYNFTYDEKKQIEEYIKSLQVKKYNYTIVNGTDKEAKSVANRLYYTSEAVEIAKVLDLEICNIDEIGAYVKTFDLSSNNSKEIMALIKLDRILGLSYFAKKDVEEAYSKLYEAWSKYKDADLQWTFDLYYMSYVYKYGELSESLLYDSFEDDVCNIISNSNTDITFKIMFLEIARNYNLITESVVRAIENSVEFLEQNCKLGDDCYSLYVSQLGSLETTYYTYAYAKACKRKLSKNVALENQVLRILQNSQTMHILAVAQSLFLANEMDIDITNMKQDLYRFLNQKLFEAEEIEDVYYAIYGMDLLANGTCELSEEQMENIRTKLQSFNKTFEATDDDLYTQMQSAFFYLLVLERTQLVKQAEYVKDVRHLLENENLEVDSDLRILYFYQISCNIADLKSNSVSKLLKHFSSNGVYYLTPDDRSARMVLCQFIGNNLKNGLGEDIPYI